MSVKLERFAPLISKHSTLMVMVIIWVYVCTICAIDKNVTNEQYLAYDYGLVRMLIATMESL